MLRVLKELEPFGLLRFARQSQLADGLGIDLFVAIGLADVREKLAKGERTLHHDFGHAEDGGDKRPGAPPGQVGRNCLGRTRKATWAD